MPFICALTEDLTRSLGMCPDWESNLKTFGMRDDARTELSGHGEFITVTMCTQTHSPFEFLISFDDSVVQSIPQAFLFPFTFYIQPVIKSC